VNIDVSEEPAARILEDSFQTLETTYQITGRHNMPKSKETEPLRTPQFRLDIHHVKNLKVY
jgi:hypothetical protein